MAAIVIERTIATAPERVFQALTQSDGIGHWWTNDLNIKPEVGSLAEFRFGEWGEFRLRFEIAELDCEQIRWLARPGGPSHWAGTSVTWRLIPLQNGTKVSFTHEGFAQQVDEAYLGPVRGNWNYFLDSLKSYLETGKGTPGTHTHQAKTRREEAPCGMIEYPSSSSQEPSHVDSNTSEQHFAADRHHHC